jgi:hypothetical protein
MENDKAKGAISDIVYGNRKEIFLYGNHKKIGELS